MATTPTAPIQSYVPLSKAPKLKYTPVEEFLKSRANTEASLPTGQAMSFYQNAAAGKPTPALSASFAANREALARQAGSMRTQTAQTLAEGGALGQGQAIRGTQETEQGILRALADSRNKEAQAIGSMQEGANQVLLDEGNRAGQQTMQAIQAGLNSKSPAMQQSSLRALSGFLEGKGVQMATADSADALDTFHATQAENDPKVALERLTSEQALRKAQSEAVMDGAGSVGQKVQQIMKTTGSTTQAGTQFTNTIQSAEQKDTNAWRNYFEKQIAAGNDVSPQIDNYIALRNEGYSADEVWKYLNDYGTDIQTWRQKLDSDRAGASARSRNTNIIPFS